MGLSDHDVGLPADVVFSELYVHHCEIAILRPSKSWHLKAADMGTAVQALRGAFAALDEDEDGNGINLSLIRQELLTKWQLTRSRWKEAFNADTCLACLVRRPSILLPCGHRFCHSCVRFFGQSIDASSERYRLSSCMLCGVATTITALTLRRRHRRLIEIDGGGVRGIIPLQFLQSLESLLETPGLFRRFFDFAIGTSSGMETDTEPLNRCVGTTEQVWIP